MTDAVQKISFTKMQGAGNDFVVINNLNRQFTEDELIALSPKLCDRKFGIGSDGLLALSPPKNKAADYTMFYRNPDGSDAGMCGNGARCLARYAHSLGFDEHHSFSVHDKIYYAEIIDSDRVCISFPAEPIPVYKIQVDNQPVLKIYTGTEHIVIAVAQHMLDMEDTLRDKGKALRHHPEFEPKGTNVNFMCGLNNSTLHLQTYERGVEDLTLACGTGAMASALAWHHLQEGLPSTRPFEVITKGGTLLVYFSFNKQTKNYSNLKLEGPAYVVFEGSYRT